MKILVTIALTVIIVQLSSIECKHPQYSFRCSENGDIHLFGLHNHSTITSNCRVMDSTEGNDYHKILNNCKPGPVNGDLSVNIVVYDPYIDGSTTTTTTSKPPTNTTSAPIKQFTGGHGTHRFNVTCKSIPQEGIHKTVVHVFQGSEFNVLPVNNMEVDGVEMRFKAVNKKDSPDINTIYVGDEFFMFLEYKGTKNYVLIPKMCMAYSGTSLDRKNQTTVKLWNRDRNGCTLNKELLQGFNSKPSKLIHAEMFGFRFSDSAYITIQCEVGIFLNTTQELMCKQGRQRRGIGNVEVKTKFAASKIRVYDNKDMYQMENKSPQQSFDNSVWIVLVIGTLLNRW